VTGAPLTERDTSGEVGHTDIWLGCCHSEGFVALLTSCQTEVTVVVEEYIGACRLSRLGSRDGIPRERSNSTIGPTLDGVGLCGG
jgi:hypothetical protein